MFRTKWNNFFLLLLLWTPLKRRQRNRLLLLVWLPSCFSLSHTHTLSLSCISSLFPPPPHPHPIPAVPHPDQSLLEEYERRVRERQKELEALRKQREELLRIESMLQGLLTTQTEQKKPASKRPRSLESREEKLMAELQHQQQLREELMKKTRKLQQLQGVSGVVT